MASTLTAATLTVKHTESITLNGQEQGGTNTFTVASIAQVSKRQITCPSGTHTGICKFGATTGGATNELFDVGDVKYLRITNLDDTNSIQVGISYTDGSTGNSINKLNAGESIVLGTQEEQLLVNDSSATPFGGVGTLLDIDYIAVHPGASNTIDVELMVASV